MNKIEALEYLVENNVYNDEWSGTGMFSILRDVIRSNAETFEKIDLEILLEKARNF